VIKARSFEEIFETLPKRKNPINVDLALPVDLVKLYESVGDFEYSDYDIAGDYIFYSYEHAKEVNNNYKEYKNSHGIQDYFWIFGFTASGDNWLIDTKDMPDISRMYFYDYDKKDNNMEYVFDLNITLAQWFVLADLISQAERDKSNFDNNYELKESMWLMLNDEVKKISSVLCADAPYLF